MLIWAFRFIFTPAKINRRALRGSALAPFLRNSCAAPAIPNAVRRAPSMAPRNITSGAIVDAHLIPMKFRTEATAKNIFNAVAPATKSCILAIFGRSDCTAEYSRHLLHRIAKNILQSIYFKIHTAKRILSIGTIQHAPVQGAKIRIRNNPVDTAPILCSI